MMDVGPDVHGPINPGHPDEFTIRELADRVIALTGARSLPVEEQLPQDESMQRQSDIGLARKTLGWEAQVQLEEGLTRTIAISSKN